MHVKVIEILALLSCLFGCAFAFDFVDIELHHALDLENPQRFTFRGNISIPTPILKTGLSNSYQNPLTDQELDNLKALARRGDFYRVRAILRNMNDRRQVFSTYTKAYNILDTQLADVLILSLDNNGFIVGATLTTPGLTFTSDVNEVREKSFKTDVLVRRTENSPMPDTATFVQKIEREREARERGEVPDKRGIFAKYWMYIIPVVLLVLLSGGAGNQGEGAK